MCGIFAYFDLGRNNVDPDTIGNMSGTLEHRGPDDCGYAYFELAGERRLIESSRPLNEEAYRQFNGVLVLGHRRLSIIDVSKAGHQPMGNETGSLWLVYNGEIYNYKELAEELASKGHLFKSKTDTEVLLHAYEEWGTECLTRFNGMWAFALWDRTRQRLFCARDRFGIKPLYYFFKGRNVIIASEIKAILQAPMVERAANPSRVADYLGYGYLDHTEETLFKDIYQLRGSHYLVLDVEGSRDVRLGIQRYWDLEPTEGEGSDRSSERFLQILEDSVRIHMRSDVPIGTCLSGGLDSSSIVCLSKQYLGSNSHKTFSSCFEQKEYDEREYIGMVVAATGSDSHQTFPNPNDLFDEINDVIWHQEEPFGSTSIYAQWNVFKLARVSGIKVILDGQGADELLAGYHPAFGYFLSELLRTFQFRNFLHEYEAIRSTHRYSHRWILGHLVMGLLPWRWAKGLRKKVRLTSEQWLRPETWSDERIVVPRKFKNVFYDHLYQSLMHFILPGLLHYEDRNSMAHSIEARVPFLDYRLAEFVFSLPMDKIVQDGTTKVILRDAMKGVLPEGVRTRKDKMGFATPEAIWTRTILRDPIQEVITSKSFAERGYVDIKKVQEAFEHHCSEKVNISSTVWRWVNLELWFRIFLDGNRNLAKGAA